MPNPSWLDSAVFYQIYPQSFCDSNGDGIGDLRGVLDKLDYLEALGVNALWLNPCFDSPFLDAGYDVRDYCRVAPRYGTNADLVALVAAAHARGIRIVLDLVAGHTSWDHPWFKASARPEPNEFTDRYVWTHNPWVTSDGELRLISGLADRSGSFAINFFCHQPALNYGFAEPERGYQQRVDDPGPLATREALRQVMAYWLERGVDGFRVDMAGSLVKRDPEKRETRRLWRELRAWLDAHYPDRVLISEWGEPALAIDGGFHIDFMLHFGATGYASLFFNAGTPGGRAEPCWFERAGRGSFEEFWRSFSWQDEHVRGKGFVGLPSSNHDFQRPACGERDARDLEVIFAFLLTWRAVPFIYYGDEIAMRYLPELPSREGGFSRCGSRTPMQWGSGTSAGFSLAPPDALYLPLDPDPERPTVAAARADPDSLWQRVRELVHQRRTHPDLVAGAPLEMLAATNPGYPLVYRRGERLWIVLNPSDAECSTHVGGQVALRPLQQRAVQIDPEVEGLRVRAGARGWGVFERIDAR